MRIYLLTLNLLCQHESFSPGTSQTNLEFPNVLALLRNILHSFSHQCNQHVQEKNKSQHNESDEEQEEQDGVLGVLLDLQVTQPQGELEQIHQDRPQAAVGVALPILLARLNQGSQSWEGSTGRFQSQSLFRNTGYFIQRIQTAEQSQSCPATQSSLEAERAHISKWDSRDLRPRQICSHLNLTSRRNPSMSSHANRALIHNNAKIFTHTEHQCFSPVIFTYTKSQQEHDVHN